MGSGRRVSRLISSHVVLWSVGVVKAMVMAAYVQDVAVVSILHCIFAAHS